MAVTNEAATAEAVSIDGETAILVFSPTVTVEPAVMLAAMVVEVVRLPSVVEAPTIALGKRIAVFRVPTTAAPAEMDADSVVAVIN